LDSIFVPALVVPTRFDAANDLALIATRTLVLHNKVIRYNRSDGVKPGHLIAAVGFPETDELTLTVGRITRLQENFLVSDAKVVPGNSGGPLIDKAGRMIGLSISTYEGEGYSLPMNLVLSVADSWVKSMKLEEIWQRQKYTSFLDMLTAPQYLIPGLVAVTGGTYAAIRQSSEAPTFGDPPHPGDIGQADQ
jgi:S1-C subfamily serine protease